MDFVFVHTADWQIGKTFGRFDGEKGAVLRQARIDVIDRIAEAARGAGARHILAAGDIFDSETLKPETVATVLGKLALHRDLIWHFIAGNHDPARPGGVWHVAAGLRPAGNIRVHLKPEPTEMEPGVFLLPASLTAKAMSSDPTAWMDQAATPAGTIRIGMAHGSIKGFGGLGEAKVAISPERAETAGLAYLALGDWHGALEINPRTWYSGTPEPDGFVDNAAGHVLIVRATAGRAQVERAPTGRFRWIERTVEAPAADGLAALETEIAALGPAAGALILRLRLAGATDIAGEATIAQRAELLRRMVFALQEDRSGLAVVVDREDCARLDDPALASVAERLAARASEGGSASEREVAQLALRRLLALARALRPERPA